MKHATIVYTCIGLMGAAAITGFADYSHASKTGLLKGLYEEEKIPNVLLHDKEIDFDDYSRAAFDYEGSEESIVMANEPKTKRSKKNKDIPPPPPPAPEAPIVIEVKNESAAPSVAEVPVIVEVPAIPVEPSLIKDEKIEAPVTLPIPAEVVEIKEVSMKSFSRGPLKKKIIAKTKKSK